MTNPFIYHNIDWHAHDTLIRKHIFQLILFIWSELNIANEPLFADLMKLQPQPRTIGHFPVLDDGKKISIFNKKPKKKTNKKTTKNIP